MECPSCNGFCLKPVKLDYGIPAKIFTEPWQHKLINDTGKKNYERRFLEVPGTGDYEKLKKIREWISNHKNNRDLLRYLLKDE